MTERTEEWGTSFQMDRESGRVGRNIQETCMNSGGDVKLLPKVSDGQAFSL